MGGKERVLKCGSVGGNAFCLGRCWGGYRAGNCGIFGYHVRFVVLANNGGGAGLAVGAPCVGGCEVLVAVDGDGERDALYGVVVGGVVWGEGEGDGVSSYPEFGSALDTEAFGELLFKVADGGVAWQGCNGGQGVFGCGFGDGECLGNRAVVIALAGDGDGGCAGVDVVGVCHGVAVVFLEGSAAVGNGYRGSDFAAGVGVSGLC